MKTPEQILVDKFGERIKTSRHYLDLIQAMEEYREYWRVKKHGKGIKILNLDICKQVTFDKSHGFVIQDMNDSVFFTEEEAIRIANFIADNHQTQHIVMVKSKINI